MNLSSFSNNNIIGVWHFVNFTAEMENPLYPEKLIYEEKLLSVFSKQIQGSTLEFKEDGTWIWFVSSNSQSYTGLWKNENNTLTISGNNNEYYDTDSFITKGESITLSDKNTLFISGNQLYTDSTYNINDMENVEYLKNEGFTKYIIYINFSK